MLETETPLFPALVPLPKRIVLQHTVGPLAGLFRIVGTNEGFPDGLPPACVDGVDLIDHEGTCSLLKVKPRYLLYREVETDTDNLPMHAAQQ